MDRADTRAPLPPLKAPTGFVAADLKSFSPSTAPRSSSQDYTSSPHSGMR